MRSLILLCIILPTITSFSFPAGLMTSLMSMGSQEKSSSNPLDMILPGIMESLGSNLGKSVRTSMEKVDKERKEKAEKEKSVTMTDMISRMIPTVVVSPDMEGYMERPTHVESSGEDEEKSSMEEPVLLFTAGSDKRPHICIDEILSTQASDAKFIDGKVSSLKNSNGEKTTKRIEQCCVGYTTDDIDKGCDKEISKELLEKLVFNNTRLQGGVKEFLIEGVTSIFEWDDQQIIENENNETFVVALKDNEFRLNCIKYKQRLPVSRNYQVLEFDGKLKSAEKNVLDVISKNPNLSTFYNLLNDDTKDFLIDKTDLTVFAFTNDAVEKLPNKTRDLIMTSMKTECGQGLIKEHIRLNERLCSDAVSGSIETMNGNIKKFKSESSFSLTLENVSDGKREVHTMGDTENVTGRNPVIDTDYYALNGIVHIIDELLIEENFMSWVDTVKSFHPTFGEQLEKLNISKSLTIFVQPNSTTIENPLNQIITDKMLREFEDGTELKMDSESQLFTKKVGNDHHIGCVRFSRAPMYTCNGAVHFVQKALPMVNQTIEEYLVSRSDLSDFYSLWKLANITTKPLITLLAPTNDAFAPNYYKKLLATKEKAEKFVKKHIVESLICEYEMNDESKKSYQTMAGKISKSHPDGPLAIGGADIQEMERVMKNGVVYVLSGIVEIESWWSEKS